MATSGTIGRTEVPTVKVIEHALRRCGILPSSQTPEIVQIALDCLYFMLIHSANTTFNLWCIDRLLMGTREGQKRYALPVGTQDLLNVVRGTPETIPGTLSVDTYTFSSENIVNKLAIKYSTLPQANLTIEVQDTEDNWLSVGTILASENYTINDWHWYDLDPSLMAKAIRVTGIDAIEMRPSVPVTEIPLEPLNQDQYLALPNRDARTGSVVNYLFDKKLNPSIILWGVPDDDSQYLWVRVHRQVQDVGRLTQTLGIPHRWFESVVTLLASKLAIEVPGVDPARITLLQNLASKINLEASEGETDLAPVNFLPGISAYTR